MAGQGVANQRFAFNGNLANRWREVARQYAQAILRSGRRADIFH